MALSQHHISSSTPMGANVVSGDGTTFRLWAPGAQHVHLALGGINNFLAGPDNELVRDQAGHWTGFVPDVEDGTKYRFFIKGSGGEGFKRDPYARELEFRGYPNCDCIVRDPRKYQWHDSGFKPPDFSDMIIYQLHVGVFYATDKDGKDIRKGRPAKFLDALNRVEYLADLGVNAVQLLPIDEFQTRNSLGYNMTDIFSPEMDYSVEEDELPDYLPRINVLLAKKGMAPIDAGAITAQIDQLKLFVDVCHLYGLAVIFDVVYNHAGGNWDKQSMDHLDLPAHPDGSNNLYFTGRDIAGGWGYDFKKPEVREFLIQNARFLFREYHIDGLRFDEVGHIDDLGGWYFCQDLTGTLRFEKPRAIKIAEYWRSHRWLPVLPKPEGMGFDAASTDNFRDIVRKLVAQSAQGSTAYVDMHLLKSALERPWNFPQAWQANYCVENHDLQVDMDGEHHRLPRVAQLAHWNDRNSWYRHSRSRVATGLLLTAPGIPLIFMGQEFLADQLWSDNFDRDELFIDWKGAEGGDRHMADFRQFVKDAVWLRRRYPALTSEPINVFLTDDYNRIVAFHRWVPGEGRHVVVVASLREGTFYNHSYRIGFPLPGQWHEVFNSDFYETLPNPDVHGNPGGVSADGPPWHGLNQSAGVTIPANSILVFAQERL